MDCEPHRALPAGGVRLDDVSTLPPDSHVGGKQAALEELQRLNERLALLQERLYANGTHRLLIVLQGMDTSGKDGTIKHVFRQVNPLGVRAVAFGRPSEEELAHDYLWRVSRHAPAAGHVAVFNRSHYEDVLVARVEGLAPVERVERRYDHIVAWEQMLVDEGTTILKFFLHISKDEQRERLQARIDDPEKRWKFQAGDLEQRKRWDDYQRAYELVLDRTSTESSPWFIVPADRKWFRNLVVSQAIIDALERLDLRPPEPPEVAGIVVE